MSQYSWSSFLSTGATNIIPLPFPFLSQTDVHVYVSGSPVPVTISDANPCVIGWPGHGLSAGAPVQFQDGSGGALPAGLALLTTYYVLPVGLTANSFQVALVPGGTPIVTTSAGTAPWTATAVGGAGQEVFGFTFNGVASVTLNQSAASLTGSIITVRRITYGLLPDVVFQVGVPSPLDMNNQTLQLLYMTQEALDGYGFTAAGVAVGSLPVITTVTAASGTIQAPTLGDLLVDLTIPAPVTVQLPLAANARAPISIVDWAKNSETYNITIIPTAPDTIPTSLIATDGGVLTFYPMPGQGYYVK